MPDTKVMTGMEMQVTASLPTRLKFTKQLVNEGNYLFGGAASLTGLLAMVVLWFIDPTTTLPPILAPYAAMVKPFAPLIALVLGWFANQAAPVIPPKVPVSVTEPATEDEAEGP